MTVQQQSALYDLNLALDQLAGYKQIKTALRGRRLGKAGRLTLSELGDNQRQLVQEATDDLAKAAR